MAKLLIYSEESKRVVMIGRFRKLSAELYRLGLNPSFSDIWCDYVRDLTGDANTASIMMWYPNSQESGTYVL